MGWTTPRTWVAGELVTAAIMNTHVRDNLATLYPVVFDVVVGRGLTGDPAAPAATIDSNTILGGSIPQGFSQLELLIYARGDTALTSISILGRFNNDSGANYNTQIQNTNNTSVTAAAGAATAQLTLGTMPAANAPANEFGACAVDVPHYAGTTNFKSILGFSYFETADSAAGQNLYHTGGVWKSAAAVTRVALFAGAGNFAAGTRVVCQGRLAAG